MATWDSADLLLKFNELAGRPTSDEVTDARKYQRLSAAQQDVISDIAAIYPDAMYRTGGPTATTTSGGIVHTFGSDGSSHAVAPLGQVWIGRNAATYPDPDLLEGDDYTNEGTQIRMVNQRVEPTLYWHGIATPSDIAAGGSAEPSLRPAQARILIVIKAVQRFAEEMVRDMELADRMAQRYGASPSNGGYPPGAFAKWMLVWKTQFRSGGGLIITGKERGILASGGVL